MARVNIRAVSRRISNSSVAKTVRKKFAGAKKRIIADSLRERFGELLNSSHGIIDAIQQHQSTMARTRNILAKRHLNAELRQLNELLVEAVEKKYSDAIPELGRKYETFTEPNENRAAGLGRQIEELNFAQESSHSKETEIEIGVLEQLYKNAVGRIPAGLRARIEASRRIHAFRLRNKLQFTPKTGDY